MSGLAAMNPLADTLATCHVEPKWGAWKLAAILKPDVSAWVNGDAGRPPFERAREVLRRARRGA
jgi:hypothetical protein